ncbi:MAG: hypothetical protein IPG04_38070 [Polyangiaceae bacterium]|nr:hypothetical protein [Polyangiaceae bacterium]
MGAKTTSDKTTVTTIIERDTVVRVDAMAGELTRRAAGAEVSRAQVLRLAIIRGIAALERETTK